MPNFTNPSFLPASTPIRVAFIGYGNAGRIFHSTFVSGVPGLELAQIVSSKPEQVAADWPHVQVVAMPETVFADKSIDLVVIATGHDRKFNRMRPSMAPVLGFEPRSAKAG